ncbi:MAG: hypothetical protein OEX02_10025 [Cyclobacteriaceae bacterium]|nr:hypothetical protein [Cyclobacteriaceae bacterium]
MNIETISANFNEKKNYNLITSLLYDTFAFQAGFSTPKKDLRILDSAIVLEAARVGIDGI